MTNEVLDNKTAGENRRSRRDLRGCSDRLVYVDLETAGQQTWRPIMQIAAAAVDANGRVLETFEAKLQFNERQATKRGLSRRHYDRRRWNREARPEREVALQFRAFLTRHAVPSGKHVRGESLWLARLVAHNAAFDGPFLRKWFERQRLYFPADYRIFCTLQRALWLFQEHSALSPPADFKLGTLCHYFGIPFRPDEAHDALTDVRATVELHRCLNRVAMTGCRRRACRVP